MDEILIVLSGQVLVVLDIIFRVYPWGNCLIFLLSSIRFYKMGYKYPISCCKYLKINAYKEFRRMLAMGMIKSQDEWLTDTMYLPIANKPR